MAGGGGRCSGGGVSNRRLSSLLASDRADGPSDGGFCASLARGLDGLSVGGRFRSRGVGLRLRGRACRVCACDELSSGVSETVRKKDAGKGKAVTGGFPLGRQGGASELSLLPDDVLEMILARLPLGALAAARCVCRKWRDLSATPELARLRIEVARRTPWLFLFGLSRDASRGTATHCFDVAHNRWCRVRAEELNGRFLFSAVGVGDEVYIVGGRSGSPPAVRTHKGILVYNPLKSSWRKASPMLTARCQPVVGAFEMTGTCRLLLSQSEKHDRRKMKPRLGASSDVYDDPHRLSIRRQLRDAFNEEGCSTEFMALQGNAAGKETRKQPSLGLIVVGGYGCWDEPLVTGEIYDPFADKWFAIARMPVDIGPPCSGAICGTIFYVYTVANKLAGYDFERGVWVDIQTLRPPPHLRDYSPKLLSSRSRLFLSCVSWCERDAPVNHRERAVRKLYELDLAVLKWREASRHPDAPMDPNAAFAADEDRLYGVEMFGIFGQVLNFVTACGISGDGQMEWSRITRSPVTDNSGALSSLPKSMVVLHL